MTNTQTTKASHYFRVLALVAALALAASLLLTQVERPARAAFPGQNGKIAFVSARDGNNEIYTMNPDGTGQTNITNNKATDEAPAFSPDGRKIAFESSRDGNFEIFVMNADGSNPVNISNNSAGTDADAAWSPDGKRIVFASDRDGDFDIFVMDTDPSTDDATNLTTNAIEDQFPAFSPAGNKIAFESFRDGGGEIFAMNADGTQPINLSNSSAGEDLIPTWSPDGKKIVFASTRDGNGDETYVMNPDGTSQTRLTVNKAFDDAGVFSPDGKKIAFASTRDGNAEIYAMNPDGTGQINLTNVGSASDGDPDWGVSADDATAPRVDKVEPAENATGVSPTVNASAFFSEAMNSSTINTTTVKLKKAGTSTSVAASVTYDAATRKATLDPNAGLSRGATYVATVTTGAKDLAGNALDQNAATSGSQPKTWKFTIVK